MNLDAYIRAKRRAQRRAKILAFVSSNGIRRFYSIPLVGRIFESIGEALWDWAFDRFARADGEANRLMEDEIRRVGGIVFKTRTEYFERNFS